MKNKKLTVIHLPGLKKGCIDLETLKNLFIVINYYNEKEVVDFVSHLQQQPCNSSHLLIVNNGSEKKNLLESLAGNNHHLSLIDPGRNTGYLGGARFGLKYWLDQYGKLPEYIILCNTDIEFADGSFFRLLQSENADVIGPAVFSSDHRRNQNPYFKNRISLNKIRLLALIYSFYPFYLVYQTIAMLKAALQKIFSRHQANQKQEVYAVHGSFMIFNRTFFSKGGTFDYGSFLYGEEIFIAEIAKKNGMKVMYDPSLKIIHHEHSTTGKFKKPLHIKYMKQSITYLLKSFFN